MGIKIKGHVNYGTYIEQPYYFIDAKFSTMDTLPLSTEKLSTISGGWSSTDYISAPYSYHQTNSGLLSTFLFYGYMPTEISFWYKNSSGTIIVRGNTAFDTIETIETISATSEWTQKTYNISTTPNINNYKFISFYAGGANEPNGMYIDDLKIKAVERDIEKIQWLYENFNTISWGSNSVTVNTNATYYNSPSGSALFNSSVDYLISPSIYHSMTTKPGHTSNIFPSEISFWVKHSITNSNTCRVYYNTIEDPVTFILFDEFIVPTVGTVKTYNSTSTPALPENFASIKIMYNRKTAAGNMYIDDFYAYMIL